jgi:K+-transporting ATPase KdpF subunit
MSALGITALVLAVGVLVYLFVALLVPEKLE